MTFCLSPAVARELRASARRRTTYWGRALLATFAVLSCLFVFEYQSLAINPARVGRTIFNLLTSIGACFAVTACLFTADSISSERRGGTLGLLFLTDQTALDVVLSKLAVRGFESLYLLLGLTPALMLSLVAGGITYAEVLRMTLGLLNLLLISLSVGIFVSTHSWGQFASILKSAGMLALIILGPIVITQFQSPLIMLDFTPLSPAGGFLGAYDRAYTASSISYWISVVLTPLMAGALLLATAVSLHFNWRKTHQPRALKPVAAGSRRLLGPARAVLISSGMGRRRFAPVARALLRMRGQRLLAWLAAINSLLASLAAVVVLRSLGSITAAISVSVIFGLVGHVLFSLVAGRFLMEARHSGELELLLVTPVGARGLLREMRMALIRIVLGPLYLVAVGGLIASAAAVQMDSDHPFQMLIFSVTYLFNSVLQVLAVMRVSMCLASRFQNLFALAGVTVGIVVVLPSIAGSIMAIVFQGVVLGQAWPGVAGFFAVCVHIAFLRWAGACLRREFRTQDRSRLDRFFDWCGSSLSGNLDRA
jgi:ABC-type transport system involved in multi-copper enzyme maturation permease subunit